MKITIYELLGMVKDGKAPKKIKYREDIYEYKSIEEGTGYVRSIQLNGLQWLANKLDIDDIDTLNDTVEILEEEKKIPEKIFLEDMYVPSEVKAIDMELENKINEIIDYLKSKGE